MNETTKQLSPPYATYGQFTGFLNRLRETSVPSRIDPTVFGNASGTAYSIISALKFLKLIDENGIPSQQLNALVGAADDARGPLLKPVIQNAYSSLFPSSRALDQHDRWPIRRAYSARVRNRRLDGG